MSEHETGNNGAGGQQDEDSASDDGGLWNEFESCATSVTHLYRNSNWRTLQQAAASATQLYKTGLECKKRSYDRGFTKGRVTLAKELSAICRYKNKVEVADIVALLSKYDLLPNGGASPRRENGGGQNHGELNAGGSNPAAVFLFQQALSPATNASSSPHRIGGLESFLQTQVFRHRKRAHSPQGGSSHAFDFVSKRFKRL